MKPHILLRDERPARQTIIAFLLSFLATAAIGVIVFFPTPAILVGLISVSLAAAEFRRQVRAA